MSFIKTASNYILIFRKLFHIRCRLKTNNIRTYFRPLLGATFAPNLASWKFSLEIVKNDFCLRGESKQNALFSENVPSKIAPISPMSRIGPEY